MERVLTFFRAENPVDWVAPGIAHTVTVVGVAETPGLSVADPAFHYPPLTEPSSVCPRQVRDASVYVPEREHY